MQTATINHCFRNVCTTTQNPAPGARTERQDGRRFLVHRSWLRDFAKVRESGSDVDVVARTADIPIDKVPVPKGYFDKVKVGIIGGMGPAAALAQAQGIFKAASDLHPPENDQQNIGVINYNVAQEIPDRTAWVNRVPKKDREKMTPQQWNDHLTEVDSANPFWGMLEAGRALQRTGADFLVMPCNTAHVFHEVLQEKLSIPILHIVDAALDALNRKNPDARKVLLLATSGTIDNGLYPQRARRKYPHLQFVYPSRESQDKEVMPGIYDKGVKAGYLENGRKLLLDAMKKALCENEADAVFLACTEIPLVLGQADAPDRTVISPSDALSEMAIRHAEALAQERRSAGMTEPAAKVMKKDAMEDTWTRLQKPAVQCISRL